MEIENVTNRKDLIIFLLEELNKKQKPVRLDEFFFEINYAKGLESFQEVLQEMTKKGWINTLEEKGGLAFGILPTISYKYSISLNGIDYLQSLKPKSKFSIALNYFNNHLKEIIIGIIITVIGGFILHLVINNYSLGFSTESSRKILKPYLKVDNYRVPPENEDLYSLDKIKITADYQGSNFTLDDEVQLIEVKFIDDFYFLEEISPSIEVLETSIENPIINKYNKRGTYNIQLKRKIVFDGLRIFDFKKTDKIQIGTAQFLVKYKLQNSIYSDTLISKIFIEK